MLLLIQPDQLKVRFSKKLKRNKKEDQGCTEGEWVEKGKVVPVPVSAGRGLEPGPNFFF